MSLHTWPALRCHFFLIGICQPDVIQHVFCQAATPGPEAKCATKIAICHDDNHHQAESCRGRQAGGGNRYGTPVPRHDPSSPANNPETKEYFVKKTVWTRVLTGGRKAVAASGWNYPSESFDRFIPHAAKVGKDSSGFNMSYYRKSFFLLDKQTQYDLYRSGLAPKMTRVEVEMLRASGRKWTYDYEDESVMYDAHISPSGYEAPMKDLVADAKEAKAAALAAAANKKKKPQQQQQAANPNAIANQKKKTSQKKPAPNPNNNHPDALPSFPTAANYTTTKIQIQQRPPPPLASTTTQRPQSQWRPSQPPPPQQQQQQQQQPRPYPQPTAQPQRFSQYRLQPQPQPNPYYSDSYQGGGQPQRQIQTQNYSRPQRAPAQPLSSQPPQLQGQQQQQGGLFAQAQAQRRSVVAVPVVRARQSAIAVGGSSRW